MLSASPGRPRSILAQLLWIAVIAGIAALVPWAAGLEGQLARGLGLLIFIGLLWLTETLHVTATALLVPFVAVLLGLLDVRAAFAGFAHPVIYLFFGGFAIAAALQTHRLDRAIAGIVVRVAGGHLLRAMLLTCLATAFLSMWISNTATTAMMLPLALGLLADFDEEQDPSVYAFLLLGIAWSANIGGIGTLVGSPPNAIVAAATGIGFGEWLVIGIPVVACMLPLALALLWVLLRPPVRGQRVGDAVPDLAVAPGSRTVVVIFLLTVAGWILGDPLARWLGVERDFDTMVALAAVLLLLATGRLQWKDIESRVNWGVLLLFGGGITLSTVMGSSGASSYLGGQLQGALGGAAPFLFLLAVTVFVVFLTELVSNTASAALLVPLFMAVAATMGSDPRMVAVAIGIAASCAFMLPVATPPDALVFGTGKLPQRTMMRMGLVMNLVAIGVVSVMVYWLV